MLKRVPVDYRWAFEDPHLDLWHFIIDEWGFPDWIRRYHLSNFDTDPDNPDHDRHVLKEARIRHVLGNNWITIAVGGGNSPMKTVYGYLPVDLKGVYDLLDRKGNKPGSWVECVAPPKWMLV